VTYTGLLHDGELHMLWHTVAENKLGASKEGEPAKLSKANPWRAFGISLDKFERIL
jgi:hypothetical protein